MRLQREHEHRVMPWANGRGSTMEIAADPHPEAWAWRLSLADVPEDGPFSSLPGVDRCLAVAAGAGMRLFVDGEPITVHTDQAVSFPGDATTRAELLDGPVRDLNLMVRRADDPRRPHLDVRHLVAGDEVRLDGALALVVLRGELTLTSADGSPDGADPDGSRAGDDAAPKVVRPFDAVFPGAGRLHASGAATVVLARLRTR